MKQINRRVFLTLCAGSLALILNVTAQAAADADEQALQHLEFTVDGAAREALLYAPAAAKTASVAGETFSASTIFIASPLASCLFSY